MKNQTTKKLLLSLVLCGLGFAAVGLLSLANPAQGKTPTKKLTQLGYGHAPYPAQGKTPTKKPTQLGYGHAPHPPQGKIEVSRGVEPIGNPLPLDPVLSETIQYRAEAAERLSDNREAAISDILRNSGVQALAVNGDISAVKDAIEFHLKLLAEYLLHGDKALLPWGRVGGKENFEPFSSAVGAITLAYVRNGICVPRDMSAGAATAFRAAANKVLASIY